MRLSRLQLRNYRCFESLDLDLAQTTVLVGANDTGKSAVLESIHRLFDPPKFQVDWEVVGRRSSVVGQLPEPSSIVGHLSDLSPAEQDFLGPLAPQGTLRLGRSSTRRDLSVLLSGEELSALLGDLDTDLAREALGGDDPAAWIKELFDAEILMPEGPDIWVDTGIWEFLNRFAFLGLVRRGGRCRRATGWPA
jgi:hypothetical protein